MKKENNKTRKRKRIMIRLIIVIVLSLSVIVCIGYYGYNFGYSKIVISAIKSGDEKRVSFALKMPGNINSYNRMQFRVNELEPLHTPLSYACYIGADTKTIQMLLNRGSNPNLKENETLFFELFHTYEDNDYEVWKLLLDWGMEIKVARGSHPIYFTATGSFPIKKMDKKTSENYFMLFQLLVNYGATYDPNNLLYNACEVNNFVLVEKLLAEDKANPNFRPLWSSQTVLIRACASKTGIETVKLLINYNADVTLKDEFGKTALDYAIESGDEEIIALLTAE